MYWNKPLATLELSRDFVPGAPTPQEIQQMAALQANGLLSQETFLRWMHSNEVFDGLDEFSVEEELDRIQDEQPVIDPLDLPGEEEEDDEPSVEDKDPEEAPQLEGEDATREDG